MDDRKLMQQRVHYPTGSSRHCFEEADELAEGIHGGLFGVLPLEKVKFRADMSVTELGAGLSVRSIQTSSAVTIRAEIIARKPSITYMLPSLLGGLVIFDGKEMGGLDMVSRTTGQTPTLRTFGLNEIGVIAIECDVMERAVWSLMGETRTNFLTTPASWNNIEPSKYRRLKALHRAAGMLLDHHKQSELSIERLPAMQIMKDEMLAIVVDGLSEAPRKVDRLAHQLQTRSMARIDRYLDEHRETLMGLQDLCLGVNSPLRTVESIIRRRTGMPALVYLRRRRLAFVRTALLKPSQDATVTTTAIRYGFWHLGRFSSYYRDVYGELPSVTLARSLGRVDRGM
jgi:AraC family ethanolamine operon transcriptional activator